MISLQERIDFVNNIIYIDVRKFELLSNITEYSILETTDIHNFEYFHCLINPNDELKNFIIDHNYKIINSRIHNPLDNNMLVELIEQNLLSNKFFMFITDPNHQFSENEIDIFSHNYNTTHNNISDYFDLFITSMFNISYSNYINTLEVQSSYDVVKSTFKKYLNDDIIKLIYSYNQHKIDIFYELYKFQFDDNIITRNIINYNTNMEFMTDLFISNDWIPLIKDICDGSILYMNYNKSDQHYLKFALYIYNGKCTYVKILDLSIDHLIHNYKKNLKKFCYDEYSILFHIKEVSDDDE